MGTPMHARDLAMPPRATWEWLVERAFAEDLGPGDVTSDALLPLDLAGEAGIEAREPLVLAGLEVAAAVFARVGAELAAASRDGTRLAAGDVAARVRGSARSILAGERTALNFLARLSGVATLTSRFVDAVSDTRARIVDTRKTLPGWRALDKYAVRCGGGYNHRHGLFDGVLIKDNHIAAVGSVAEAVRRARRDAPGTLRIRVEVESAEAAQEALEAGADDLLVDNRTPEEIERIAKLAGPQHRVEASGGVTLETARAIALCGVHEISVGRLTHSAPAVDLSLEWNATSSR